MYDSKQSQGWLSEHLCVQACMIHRRQKMDRTHSRKFPAFGINSRSNGNSWRRENMCLLVQRLSLILFNGSTYGAYPSCLPNRSVVTRPAVNHSKTRWNSLWYTRCLLHIRFSNHKCIAVPTLGVLIEDDPDNVGIQRRGLSTSNLDKPFVKIFGVSHYSHHSDDYVSCDVSEATITLRPDLIDSLDETWKPIVWNRFYE